MIGQIFTKISSAILVSLSSDDYKYRKIRRRSALTYHLDAFLTQQTVRGWTGKATPVHYRQKQRKWKDNSVL